MSGEEGGLTLQGLAHRLEVLEQENAELRRKVATSLEGSGTRHHANAEPATESSEVELEGRMSRRRMLSNAGVAAAGLVVAGALTQRDIREAKAAAPETFTSNVAGTPGVTGTNTAGGIGVKAEGAVGVFGDNFGSGEGVRGVSSGGYGGLFSGGKAQLKLIPGGSSGRPGGGHSKGEIYMGSGGALFVCVQGGRPGKWRKVSTTAVP
jgi:hypothetical protein